MTTARVVSLAVAGRRWSSSKAHRGPHLVSPDHARLLLLAIPGLLLLLLPCEPVKPSSLASEQTIYVPIGARGYAG